jgi:hypothetical protein
VLVRSECTDVRQAEVRKIEGMLVSRRIGSGWWCGKDEEKRRETKKQCL